MIKINCLPFFACAYQNKCTSHLIGNNQSWFPFVQYPTLCRMAFRLFIYWQVEYKGLNIRSIEDTFFNGVLPNGKWFCELKKQQLRITALYKLWFFYSLTKVTFNICIRVTGPFHLFKPQVYFCTWKNSNNSWYFLLIGQRSTIEKSYWWWIHLYIRSTKCSIQ